MSNHVVGEQMTKSLVTTKDSDTLESAHRLMFINKIRHLPVRDKKGEIVGILSDRDLQRAMESKISDAFGFKLESVKFPENAKVFDYMSWPVKTFSKDTDVKLVLQNMLNEKVSAYLITDGTEIEGIVTTDDFLHLLFKLLDNEDEPKTYILADVLSNPIFGRFGQIVSDAGI